MERLSFTKERIIGTPTYEIHHSYRFDYEKSRRIDSWQEQNLKFIYAIDANIRLYSLHEIIDLFDLSGWTYAKSFGNYQLESVEAQKPTIIIIGKKR